MAISRFSRPLTVKSSAIPKAMGEDMLVPLRLSGTEGINELFCYKLLMQTPDMVTHHGLGDKVSDNLVLDDMIGREISCTIELEGMGSFVPGRRGDRGASNIGAGKREINAIITEACFVAQVGRHSLYELTLRPWFYLTTLRTNCRVFQNRDVKDIINTVLGDYSFSVERYILPQTLPYKDYQIQYNETDFEFVTRLFQENGINYFFKHENTFHRLVYTNHNAAFQRTQKDEKKSHYHTVLFHEPDARIDTEYVHAFSSVRRLTPGMVAARDYDYTRPTATLEVSARDPRPTGHARLEHYLWRGNRPGLMGLDYSQPNAGNDIGASRTAEPQGQAYAQQRMELLRQHGNRAHGQGHIRGIVPGCSFTLEGHPLREANTEYIVLHTHFTLQNTAEITQTAAPLSNEQRERGQWSVVTDFEVQPSTQPLRPEHTCTKPVIGGVETAVVVGPEAKVAQNNVYSDELSRIKVQFHWDREGKSNHNSSCWIRVSSQWAGNQLGVVSIPRVGQEVVVSFIGGDPDLPLVTGSVYNQDNLPPWQLSSQYALTGLRSRELVDGGGNAAAGRSNHVILDDTKDKIQVQLKSDHQASQLSLGFITRIEDNDGRKDARGQGMELRTDGHGAIRAQQGILITAQGRQDAAAHITDMGETVARLIQGQSLQGILGTLAQKSKAHEVELDQQEVALTLQLQNASIMGVKDSALFAAGSLGLSQLTGRAQETLEGAINNPIQQGAEAVQGAIDSAVDSAKGALNRAQDAVNGAVGSAVGGAVSGIQSTIGKGTEALQGLPGVAAAGEALHTVAGYVGGLPGPLTQVGGMLFTQSGAAYDLGADALSGAAGTAAGAVSGMTGFASAAKTASTTLANTATDLAGALGAKSLQDIEARVMSVMGDAASGTSSGVFPEFRDPHVVIASPAGVHTTTPQSTHIASGNHAAITSGGHTTVGAGRRIILSALGGIRLFTHKMGMKLIAAAGKIDIQAQTDAMNLMAQKDIEITSTNGEIIIRSPKRIRIESGVEVLVNGGTSYTQWTGTAITHGTNGLNVSHAATHSLTGPDSKALQFKSTAVEKDYSNRLDVHDLFAHHDFSNLEYDIKFADGTLHSGIIDHHGRTGEVFSDTAQKVKILVGQDKKEGELWNVSLDENT